MEFVQDVVPDIVVCGKAMGNGYPIAAVMTSHKLAEAFCSGPLYFNTFGGGTAACASALAVLHAIDELQLQTNAAQVGDYLMQGLQSIRADFPSIVGDVRGKGLFIGAEIVSSEAEKTPSPARAVWIQEKMKEQYVRAVRHLVLFAAA
jgi:4-aminobutyrate aminotransferase-like enzyme